MATIRARIDAFCSRFGTRVPVLLAPMAGVDAPSLSVAVANSGGMGAAGVLLMQPAAIENWAREFRAGNAGPADVARQDGARLLRRQERITHAAGGEGRERQCGDPDGGRSRMMVESDHRLRLR